MRANFVAGIFAVPHPSRSGTSGSVFGGASATSMINSRAGKFAARKLCKNDAKQA
jgi:hypothetical protein